MKKVFAVILTVAVLAAMAVLPVSAAEAWEYEVNPLIAESLDSNEETDYADDHAAPVYVDKGGDMEMILRRPYKGPVSAFVYALGDGITEGDAVVGFDFNYEVSGDYGVAIRIVTDLTAGDVDWTFLNQIAIVGAYEGKAALQVWNDTLEADANGRKLAVAKVLEKGEDYTFYFVLTPGSNQYTVVVNGEVCGTYTHFETPSEVCGVRLDQHGYTAEDTTAPANLIDEMYFDNFVIGTPVEPGAAETEAPADETEAPATEAPATEAPATEAPATEAPATEAPATTAPTTAPTQVPAEEESGCGSVIASGAAVLVVMAAAFVLRKRK